MIKQRDAVFQAIVGVFNEHGVRFEEGMNAKSVMTDAFRKQICAVITEGFKAGRIQLSDEARAKYNTDALLSGYTSGLVNNWLRKDTRLNGNTKYTPAKPGSRQGSSDPEIKNLRLLLKSGKLNAEQTAMVEARLAARQTEYSASKAKSVVIDFSVLPSDLVEELGITQ